MSTPDHAPGGCPSSTWTVHLGMVEGLLRRALLHAGNLHAGHEPMCPVAPGAKVVGGVTLPGSSKDIDACTCWVRESMQALGMKPSCDVGTSKATQADDEACDRGARFCVLDHDLDEGDCHDEDGRPAECLACSGGAVKVYHENGARCPKRHPSKATPLDEAVEEMLAQAIDDYDVCRICHGKDGGGKGHEDNCAWLMLKSALRPEGVTPTPTRSCPSCGGPPEPGKLRCADDQRRIDEDDARAAGHNAGVSEPNHGKLDRDGGKP